MAVEQWLGVVELAPKSKLHLRNVLHVLFECAARWELIKENPITRVRQGGARRAEPDVLTPEEFRALLAELTTEPYRMMVILAGCLGLSRSEFTGLRWADIDWDAATLSVQRGVVHCHVGKPKTLARRKSIPLAHNLLTIVSAFRNGRPSRLPSVFFFPPPKKRGNHILGVWPLGGFWKPPRQASGHHENGGLAHVPAQLQHAATGERYGCEGAKRIAPALEHRHHSEPVHASCE